MAARADGTWEKEHAYKWDVLAAEDAPTEGVLRSEFVMAMKHRDEVNEGQTRILASLLKVPGACARGAWALWNTAVRRCRPCPRTRRR